MEFIKCLAICFSSQDKSQVVHPLNCHDLKQLLFKNVNSSVYCYIQSSILNFILFYRKRFVSTSTIFLRHLRYCNPNRLQFLKVVYLYRSLRMAILRQMLAPVFDPPGRRRMMGRLVPIHI